MLMSPSLPAALQPHLLALLNSLVSQISSLHELVTKRVKAQAYKEANMDDDDSDDEDDSDSSDEGDKADAKQKVKQAKMAAAKVGD